MRATQLRSFVVWPTPNVKDFVELKLSGETEAVTRVVQISRHLALLAVPWCIERDVMSTHARLIVLFASIPEDISAMGPGFDLSVYPSGVEPQDSLVGGLQWGSIYEYIQVFVDNRWTSLGPEEVRDCMVATWVYVVDCAAGGLSQEDRAALEEYLRSNYGHYRWVSQERQDRQSKVWVRAVADIDEGGVARTRIEASLDKESWEKLVDDFPAQADLFALTQVMRTIRLTYGRLQFDPRLTSSMRLMGTVITPRAGVAHVESIDLKAWAAPRREQRQA